MLLQDCVSAESFTLHIKKPMIFDTFIGPQYASFYSYPSNVNESLLTTGNVNKRTVAEPLHNKRRNYKTRFPSFV